MVNGVLNVVNGVLKPSLRGTWQSTKLKHWVTIWVEPLTLVCGVVYLCGPSPKLKHWVAIWIEPLVLASGEIVP